MQGTKACSECQARAKKGCVFTRTRDDMSKLVKMACGSNSSMVLSGGLVSAPWQMQAGANASNSASKILLRDSLPQIQKKFEAHL